MSIATNFNQSDIIILIHIAYFQSFKSLWDFRICLIKIFMVVVTVKAVLINQIRNRWLKCSTFNAYQITQKLLILLDRTNQYTSNNFSLLIFLYNLFDSSCIFLPNIFSNKRRISQNKIKVIMKFFWNLLRMIKVILVKIRIILGKFRVVLNRRKITSNKNSSLGSFGENKV